MNGNNPSINSHTSQATHTSTHYTCASTPKVLKTALVGLSLTASGQPRLSQAASFLSQPQAFHAKKLFEHNDGFTPGNDSFNNNKSLSLAPISLNNIGSNAQCASQSRLLHTQLKGKSGPNMDNHPKPVGGSGSILRVTTLQAYKEHVADENDKMVCVKFFSPYCRACKKIEGQFKQLAKTYPDIKFIEVPLLQGKKNDNTALFNGLEIPSLPFGHIYHPQAGLVEENRINHKCIGEFGQKLSHYTKGECPLDDAQ